MNLRSASGTMLLGILAVVLVLVASWMLLISPVLGDTSTAKDATSATQDRNRTMTAEVATLEAQQRNLSVYEDTAAELETLFPPTADQPGFFAAVIRAAGAAGIPADMVTALSPTAPQLLDMSGQPIPTDAATSTDAPVASDVAAQTVEIKAEGSYGQIQQLLANLERMERTFEVTTLDVSSVTDDAEGSSANGTLTVSITGSTYVASPLTLADAEDESSTSAAG